MSAATMNRGSATGGTEPNGPETSTTGGRARRLLDYAAPLVVQVRAQAFTWPAAPPQRLTLEINGAPQPALTVPVAWTVVEQTVPVTAWRAGVNRVVLRFARATRPRDVGVSGDDRLLSAAVDYIRVVEVR